MIVIGYKGELVVKNDAGRELQIHNIEYGSVILVQDEQKIKAGTKVCEWDSNNAVVIAEDNGTIEFVDIIPNITVQQGYDDHSEKMTMFVIEQKNDKYQPSISIAHNNKPLSEYTLPVNSIIVVEENGFVSTGDVIAKIPREASKTKDITGGLPKIAMLFEARMVKSPCVLAEVDGRVTIGQIQKNMRTVSLVGKDRTVDYLIPRSKILTARNGDLVKAGDHLTDGNPALHDLMRIMGMSYVQYYLINQVQSVYRSNGVTISDRHFELIVRQMTRKVRISDSGDTSFLTGDRVAWAQLAAINDSLIAEGKAPAKASPELIGITLASLGTESFIAAASFQETTRILSEAAVSGQVDYLYGPKENVIIGRLIPAGTGFDKSVKEYML